MWAFPRWTWLLLLAAALGACGVGSVEESSFAYGLVGTEGGLLDIGTVQLSLPSGALAQPTAVAIVPDTESLPVQAPPEDECVYTLLGAQYCCGPRGLALLRDGTLRVHYEEDLVPVDRSEDDLVLLLWDESALALIPVLDAAHDAAGNAFSIADYGVLGYFAVGIRTCPEPPPPVGFAFLAGSAQPRSTLGGGTAQTAPFGPGLYLATADVVEDPVPLPPGPEFPVTFAPSPDGTRILFETYVQTGAQDYPVTQLFSVGAEDETPTLLVGDDELLTSSDPTHGWMRDSARVFYTEVFSGEVDENYLSTVPGAGGSEPTRLYDLGAYAYVEDVRQSPDGSQVLIRYYDQFEEERIDVFDAATGDPLSQGVIPRGGGQATPRFLPSSSGVYLVDESAGSVVRFDADGSNESTLFTLPEAQGYLKDFVLAPNGDDYAYVARADVPQLGLGNQQVMQNTDVLYVGSLSGGARGERDLEGYYYFDELIFHPDGQTVFLDSYFLGVQISSAADASLGPSLPVTGISKVDVSAADGRLLLVVEDLVGTSGLAQTLPPGVYVAEADGTNITQVTLPFELVVLEARWLRSTRTAPCMGYVNRVR